MESDRRITPEEKLLHIIEKPEDIDRLGLNKKGKLFDPKRSLSFLKKIGPKKITLHSINKTLVTISAVITITLVFFFIKGEKYMQARFEDLKENIKKEVLQLSNKQEELPNLSMYLTDTEKNSPFHVLPNIKKSEEVKEEEKPAKLKLVGIIWSDDPQAIIEDETSGKSYLVYEGDTVDKFEVTKISQDEVKLISENGDKILR